MTKIKNIKFWRNPHFYTIVGSALMILAGEYFPKTRYVIYDVKFSSNLTQICAALAFIVFVILPALSRLALVRGILGKFGINIGKAPQ